jgi:4-hydroxybenzoate polyprenyltransferase
VDRARAKRWLTERFGHHVDPAHLPYEEAAVALIETHRSRGGRAWLVSGSDEALVSRIAAHLGMFEFSKGSTPGENLTSSRKAGFLKRALPEGFAYAGNSRQDLAVWKVAAAGYGFRAPQASYRIKNKSSGAATVEKVLARQSQLGAVRKAMRLHQWAKNILVFVVPGLVLSDLTGLDLIRLFAGFFFFGLMASGTYILNDLFDIPDDRRHATKRFRQIADGRLNVPLALAAMIMMVVLSLSGSFLLDPAFGAVVSLYACLTVAYSFFLKRLPIIDVFVLAGLFTLRVWGGGELVAHPPTAWFAMFIGLVFLSLALAKRYIEIAKSGAGKKISGRGYQAEDGPVVLAFGAATASAAILALAVYGLLAPNRLIDNPSVMMTVACVVGAWFMRIWLVAGRGELNDDPVLFAVKDKVSLACLVLVAAFLAAESTRPIWSQWF